MPAQRSVLVLAPLLLAGAAWAAGLRMEDGVLWVGESKFVVRGVAYSNEATWGRACLLARDLPLIAAMGANTVRTYALLPEDDSAFQPLLESTGLYWLAGFPLDPFHGPDETITDRKAEILDAFRRYVERFRGEPRLIGYVFGSEVARDYPSKFAGSPEEFYSLLEEAAAILREAQGAPLLTTAVHDVEELAREAPGLSFWSWNARPAASFGAQLEEARRKATLPLLISEYGHGAPEEEGMQAEAAVTLTREIGEARTLLGGVYNPFTGIFRATPVEAHGYEELHPRLVFWSLARMWGVEIPASWGLREAPNVEQVIHAAAGGDLVSPGALVRLAGSGLADQASTAASEAVWPLHLGTSSFCMGELPAPLGLISPGALTAQVPWDAPLGDSQTVLFRAGRASNPVPVRVREHAPGVFPGGVARAGTGCVASAGNGVRPGEVLEVYATGLGAEPYEGLQAIVNGTPAAVLFAGLLPSFTGLNQVNVRVDPATAPSSSAHLELRVGGVTSNLYPLSVAGHDDRPGIRLDALAEEVVVQAGGKGRAAPVRVEGVHGYCGPVLFQAAGLPPGISWRAPVAFTGQTAPIELRAAARTRPAHNASLLFYGHASGTETGHVSVRLTVLPDRGEIPVRVVSGGYNSGPLARFEWSGRTVFLTAGGGPGRGVNVLSVDPESGVFSSVRTFDTWGDETAAGRLVEYLAGLPEGALALFAVADDGSYLLSAAARGAIAVMFGSRLIGTLGYQDSWAMIGRKGAADPLAEGASADKQIVLESVVAVP